MEATLSKEDIKSFVEANIGIFHRKRIESLNNLKLEKVLERKNPYLFKAKNVSTAAEIVEGIVNAHISSSEEAVFGEFLEGLAIFISQKLYSGIKSGITGMDLEFTKEGIKYIVSIKSGPNWGNASQIKKMRDHFLSAKRTLNTNTTRQNIVAVNGCCYGRDNQPDKGDYLKYCGQTFWEFISGMPDLYTDLIEPLGYKAKEKNDEFLESYPKIINQFTQEFINEFCNEDYSINWNKIVILNSATIKPKKPRVVKPKIKANKEITNL